MEYDLDIQDIANRYVSGEPEYKIAEHFKVSRDVITRRLNLAGIRRRTESEARKFMWINISVEEKKRLMSFPHNAIRGISQSFKQRCKVAKTREAKQIGIGRGELMLANRLIQRGLAITLQKAIGIYNIDVAIHEGCIAVEIFGGNWHTCHSHARRFRKRCDYILNQGWLPVIIWVTKDFPLEDGAIQYLVTLSKRRSSGKPLRSKEKVIRGDGNNSSGKHDPENGSIIRS